MDFAKIGRIIPVPMVIKYRQMLMTAAMINGGSLKTLRFSIGFFAASCSLENTARKKIPSTIKPPLASVKTEPPLRLLTPISRAEKPSAESSTKHKFSVTSALGMIFCIKKLPAIMIKRPSINRDANTPRHPTASSIKPA